ncbi:PTS sugar transporter subunit IIA [Cetobacterium somerae]|uniref:PTS sugar transporter subunit IIA n=1 Tax=Cetobacterium somerae TaxID=188913 RepID=UPI00211E840F|nr:PTS sugar transporter subunit IIA [Cetobacterium somerae]MCQ9627238.1 PTS sugar transporter subunit IIA [Cetobacterium somerae]
MELKQSLIENKSIKVGVEAKNWQDAIKKGTDLLIKSKAVKEEYFHSIIKNTEEYGPYYIILPEVAMPHARPECGVIKDSFSLITLREPVSFQDKQEKVSIVITLAATSSENHNEKALIQIAELFDNENNVEIIKKAKNIQEILDIL